MPVIVVVLGFLGITDAGPPKAEAFSKPSFQLQPYNSVCVFVYARGQDVIF